MRRIALFAALFGFFAFAVLRPSADVRVVGALGAGLGVEGRKGFLGPSNTHTSFVVRSDESVAYLLFIWDGAELQPWVRVEKKGSPIVQVDLMQGNRVTLSGKGTYTLTISAHAGSGHWMCVVLGGREWDP